MRLNAEVPGMSAILARPDGRVRVIDILMAVMGTGAEPPSVAEATAIVMGAGYHVTAGPAPALPLRPRTPGTAYAPAASKVLGSVSADSMQGRLLVAFASSPAGLTDEEAAKAAGISLRSGYWKRCSDLRGYGLIQPVENEHGDYVTRPSASGIHVGVCAVTPEGEAVARELM